MTDETNPYSDDPLERAHQELNEVITSAIGQCVTVFSNIENCTDLLFIVLCRRHGMASQAATILANGMNLRTKCETMTGLTFALIGNDSLIEQVSSTLNRVTNDLRNRRNRLLHDVWTISAGSEISLTKRTGVRLRKVQSRTFGLDIPKPEEISIDLLWSFIEDCIEVQRDLVRLAELLVGKTPLKHA